MALFPLAFNLSFAQEVEVSTEETESFWTETVVPEGDTSMDSQQAGQASAEASEWQAWSEVDSSEKSPQNDSLLSSWTEGEGSYEWVDNLNAQDFHTAQLGKLYSEWQKIKSFWTKWNEVKNLMWETNENIQDSSAKASEWQVLWEVDSLSQAPQNDEQNTRDSSEKSHQNDEDTQEDENLNEDSDEELEPELIISEVYYDGKDERIEIYNIWNGAFYGDIELSWAIYYASRVSQTYTDIQIPANDFLIIANSDEMFNFDWDVNIILNEWNYKKFSISDKNAIQISLVLSWKEVDTFFAHEYRVKFRDNWEVSFHKILTSNGPIVTRAYSNDKANIIDPTEDSEPYANPWVLYTYADGIVDYSKDPNAEIGEEFEPMDCSEVYQSPVTISEVFWWGNRYNPYVEFAIHDDLEWYDFEYLLLTGSAVKTPIFIDLLDEDAMYYDIEDLEKNTKLILTTTAWDLAEAGLITIVLQSDFELNLSGWELQLYGIDWQGRQVLDIVKIGSEISEKSVYRPNSIHTCGEEMDNVNSFSPGFDESALKYFSVTSSYNEKIVEKVKYVGWGGGCSCPSKEQLCWKDKENAVQTGGNILTWSGVDSSLRSEWQTWSGEGDANNNPGSVSMTDQNWNREQNANGVEPGLNWVEDTQDSSLRSEWQIKIISLEPKSPESITLQSFIPYDIDFSNHNYYLKSSTSNSKKYIDWILYSNTIDTFTKNFWFVDGWACVYLYSWDNQLDSYCYSSEKSTKEKSDQKNDSFNPSDYQISIIHIDYDPDGTDSGNETITIQSNSSKALDLSKIKMKVNATNKKITWTLEPYSTLTLKWSFGFPNSTKDGADVVVILFYDNHIFSTYTYNPNKPKIEIPDGAVKVYSVIDGDTFRYRKEDGSLQSVRLLGVDAPESNTARYRTTECFWKEAKNYLTNLIKNQYVTLEYDSSSASSDAYGRMLAYVYLDWKLVNETLIAEWYAKEYTYKTEYSHQSDFKQAEENARKSEKWLRSSATCWKSIEEEPEAWWIDYEKLSIKISNVIYDPDWTDSWNEILQFTVDNSQISTLTSIDFSDDFSLTIFPRSEYATWTTKNKKLSELGIFDLSLSSDITLKWDFGLPNNRATCMNLNQWSYTFDTRCYNPNWPLSDDEAEAQTWDFSTLPDVKIQSIIPNPSWKDSWKEEITLLWSVDEDIQTNLDLSPDFSLLINWKTKKKLVWNLIPNQNITIKWSFWLPNSASCVSLLYKWEALDEFCYSKASDGVKFNSDNTSVHEIPAEELSIVKKITLVKQWDKLCVSYNKTLFSCKSIPNSTTEKNKKQLSMQNTFITQLEDYIKSNYASIYYDSEIKDYFELYSDAKKAIKVGSGDFTWNDSHVSVTNISSLFPDEYEQDARDYFVEKFEWTLPEILSLTLLQAEDEYNKKQVEKSDLGFLSFAK